jgi:hypothetical protein
MVAINYWASATGTMKCYTSTDGSAWTERYSTTQVGNGYRYFSIHRDWPATATFYVRIELQNTSANDAYISQILAPCMAPSGTSQGLMALPGCTMRDGLVGAPGLPFTADLNSGIYRIGADNWGFATGGALTADMTTTAFRLAAGKILNVDHIAEMTGSHSIVLDSTCTTVAITPAATATYDQGSSTKRYANIYCNHVQQGADNNIVYHYLDAHHATLNWIDGEILFRRSRGTMASPSAAQATDYLGQVVFRGYGTAAWQTGAYIRGVAVSNFTDSSAEGKMDFYATANASATPGLIATIAAAGLTLANTKSILAATAGGCDLGASGTGWGDVYLHTGKGVYVMGVKVLAGQQAAPAAGELTALTHTAPGTPDYAIQDLTNSSGYGFVTKDEGNTVLKVVANLQACLAQVIDALQAHGLIGPYPP